MLLLSFFYLGLSGWLIYMGVLIKSSGLWKIISDNSMFVEGVDLHNMLFMSLIGCGCFCFLTSFMSFVTICKASKLKLCYLPFGFATFIMSGYLLILGSTTHKISVDLVTRVEGHCSAN